MLHKALQNLPSYSGLHYTMSTQLFGAFYKTPSLSSLSPVERQRLGRDIISIASLMITSGPCCNQHTCQASGPNLKVWSATAVESLSDCNVAMSALQHPSLSFDMVVSHSKVDATTLAHIISCTTTLQSLRLSFDQFSRVNPQGAVPLPLVIHETIRWEYLGSLLLQSFSATEGRLKSILLRHASSLCSLELSNMCFTHDDNPDQKQG
jgi:hypothetical protein